MSHLGTSLLLKNKESVFESKVHSVNWQRYGVEFFIVSILGMLFFGGLAADSTSWHAVWLQAVKFVALYWGSILLCLPSLFVFSAVRGSKITVSELAYYTVAGMATIGVVLLSIAPITGFFAWTTNTAATMQSINLLTGGVALLFGLYFIGRGYNFIHELRKTNDTKSQSGLDFFVLWFFLLMAVMAQMVKVLNLAN